MATESKQMMNAADLRAFFARRDAAYGRHDWSTLAGDYAQECVVESPASGRVVGLAAIGRATNHWFTAFPDFVVRTEDVLSEGRQVALTATISGTDTGGFLGQQPTGKRFQLLMVMLYRFDEECRISQEQRIYDMHGLMLQLASGPIASEATHDYQTTLNRARIEQELKLAADIQRALLPGGHHAGMGFDLAAKSVPCRSIGGDFFDYFDLPSGAFGFAVGDVSGKGPPAALLAAELQGILASRASVGTPAEIVRHVNGLLARRTIEGRFVTMVYGVLSDDGGLTYSNAGHNHPVLIGSQGTRRLTTGGLILGAFKQAEFEEETIQLAPGDVLVVFSDGVTEALNSDGVEFGDEQLLQCVASHHGTAPGVLLDRVLGAVTRFSAEAAQTDDVTALVLRYTGASQSSK
jgi:serine phosphatase RsbU (regulator of sigma subunit)